MRRILILILICSLLCPVVHGAQQPKYVALTFDDGPSGRFTRRLLEGLEQRDVKATFLLCGYRMKDYGKLTQDIFDRGHEIGLHGYSHADMGKMTCAQILQEIRETSALLPEGCQPTFIRPPGGSSSIETENAAKMAGLSLLFWSVDPQDWCKNDAGAVEAAVVDAVQDGDIILLHDMSDCSVDAAFAIIDKLQRQGFVFVTVSELARRKGITPQPGVGYSQFR